MDFYVESLGNQWESRGCLKGFCRSFYKDVMGMSVRILWGFNEMISIGILKGLGIPRILQDFYKDFFSDSKGFTGIVCRCHSHFHKYSREFLQDFFKGF